MSHQRDLSLLDILKFVILCKRKKLPFRAPPVPPCRYMEEIGLAAMLATKRLAGFTLELNLSVIHMPLPSANKATHSGFETQRRYHQKSKTGASVAPQTGLMSSNIFTKKRNSFTTCKGIGRFLIF